MKKLCFLFALCLLGFAGSSQTITVYSTGAALSYTTGSATSGGGRSDGNIVSTAATRRGYAVFDLSALPTGSTVTSVTVGFDVATYGGSGTPSGWGTYGFAGDLSTVTVGATLFADMIAGTFLSNATYGTGIGNQTLSSNPAMCSFVESNAGTKVSISWTGGNTRIYTITGETGPAATAGTHAPYLQIVYNCTGVSGVTASAAPNPVCEGATLTLTGAASGTTHYTWAGPGGYSSTLLSPTLTASLSSAGVYTLTAFNAGGCGTTATTASVVVNPSPAPIVGPSSVCVSSTITLIETTGGGSWGSTPTGMAPVTSGGVVTGGSPGVATVSYTLPSGCSASKSVTVYGSPSAIGGSPHVCPGSVSILSDASPGGTWTSSTTTVATVGSSTGVVYGLVAGTTVITYSTGCGTPATLTVTVHPLPAVITGFGNLCLGSTTILSDVSAGGTWNSLNPAVATVGTGGVVSGAALGTADIIYTLPTGCYRSRTVTVNGAPTAVVGPPAFCQGATVSFSDAATGGRWFTSNPAIATIDSFTGLATGMGGGTAIITYSNGCGPAMTMTITVNPLPAPITGNRRLCLASTTTLADATPFGVWSATSTAIATVGSTGIVSGVSVGTATVTYMLSTGCFRTAPVTVNPVAAPITAISDSVCQGSTITYNDAVSGGIWSSSNTSIASVNTTGIVRGISMGSATITYEMGASCFVTKPIKVNPWAPIAGRDSVCVGLITYLSDIVGGGTWSSSMLSIATVDLDSGRITGVSPGTTVITYLLPTGCTGSATFRVIDFPNPITGLARACPGTTTTLSDITPGGTWSAANTSVATVGLTSGVVTGVYADTVDIAYSILPGCPVHTTVTINPLPAPISGNKIMCPGGIDTLADATPGGKWSSTTMSVATIIDSSGIISALAGGAANIVYTLPTGCLATKTVSVNPAPHPTITYQYWINSFYTDSGYVSYQWGDSLEGLIPGATSRTVAALYNTDYFVVVVDKYGCTGASDVIHYNPIEAGVTNIGSVKPVKIYPNPSTGVLFIESAVKVRAVISGIEGRLLLEQEDAREVDISKLPEGVYLVGIYDESGQLLMVQKVVKQ